MFKKLQYFCQFLFKMFKIKFQDALNFFFVKNFSDLRQKLFLNKMFEKMRVLTFAWICGTFHERESLFRNGHVIDGQIFEFEMFMELCFKGYLYKIMRKQLIIQGNDAFR